MAPEQDHRPAQRWFTVDCGPDVYDYPTIRDRLGFTQRPNAALERQLEIQLRELEHQARPEARLEAEAEIEM